MKFIGQYIQSFIARFRNDVYLEDVSSGTIASGGNLGLDSNNKIVKQADTGITDLHGAGVDGSANQLLTDDGDGSVTSESNLTFDGSALTVTGDLTVNGDNITFQSANADDPIVTIKNTSNAANDMASLKFVKDRGATPGVGDNLAEIYFIGEDADQNSQEYGRILCETDVVTGGQESGVIKMGVANHDGGNGYGLIMQGGSVDDEVDVTVGLGAASLTTIAGDLSVTTGLILDSVDVTAIQTSGELFADNDTSLMTSASINDRITSFGYGDITSVVAGTNITGGGTSGDVTLNVATASDSAKGVVELATTAETTTGTDAARVVTPDGLKDGYRGSTNVTTVGTITSGTWRAAVITTDYIAGDAINGDKIADDAVDSEHYTDGSIDTAHIADDQVTFAKAIGITPNIYGSIIKVLPSDFMANEEPGVTKTLQFVDNSSSGIKPGDNDTELLAFVSIPETMKATHVDVYADDTLAFSVYEFNIHESVGDLAGASKGTGNCNTTLDITDVNATATNYLLIQVVTVAKADRVWGAKVTIATQ